MFYNTGIATYVWVLSTKKSAERTGRAKLVDGTKLFRKMRKGLGSKRNQLGPDDIAKLVELYEGEVDGLRSKTFTNEAFFYRTITVERPLRLNWALAPDRLAMASEAKTLAKIDLAPLAKVVERTPRDEVPTHDLPAFRKHVTNRLADAGVSLTAAQLKALISGLSERDENAPIVRDAKNRPERDPTLRDTENVPWNEDIHAFFAREVSPFAPDAWIDEAKTKEGCEIPFTRHFYQYVPPRALAEIDADLDAVLG